MGEGNRSILLPGAITNIPSLFIDWIYEEVMETNYYVHPSSDVSPKAIIGNGTKIWQHCQVREDAVLGSNCILSKGVYIDFGVHIGNNVKIQNGISVYHGVTLEDGVFCGPHCVFTNDKQPRSINPDGTLKSADDWVLSETLVRKGAAIGAHATIVCGVTIGQWAMVGAGSVVTHDVPDYGLVFGNPARLRGFVCPCGEKLVLIDQDTESEWVDLTCPKCQAVISIPLKDYQKLAL
jgi:UDP-2-acetamido-3-amino-2,3-dideoxy-glucuronate N-acetyltransferase